MKKKINNNKHNKYKGRTGYRLHGQRLAFSSKRAIRTIKFPLGRWDEGNNAILLEGDVLDFAGKIKYDYNHLYGSLNITTYKEFEKSGNSLYSLKDFWVDCLRAGMIMRPTNMKLSNDLRIYDGSIQDLDKKQRGILNKDFLKIIDFEKFKHEFILQGSKRFNKKTTEQSLFNKIKGCINENNIKEEKKGVNGLSPVAQNYCDKISKDLLGLIKNKGDQEKYWKSYGVDRNIYNSDSSGSTFYLFPSLKFDKSLPVYKCIERIYDWTGEHNFGNQDIKEFVGISSDAGGLSQIFNVRFRELCSGDIKSIKKLLFSVNAKIWYGKDKELEERLKWLSGKAKLLGEPKAVKNWDEYRTDFGGKISSWLSNTLGQQEKIYNILFAHKELKRNPKTKQSKQKLVDGQMEELLKVEKELKEGGYDEDGLQNRKESVINAIKEMCLTLKNIEKIYKRDNKIDEDLLLDYREQLSNLRTNLNFLYQKKYGDVELDIKQQKNKKSVEKMYPKLFKEVPRTHAFLGEVKIKEGGVYDKYFESYKRVKCGIDLFISIDKKKFNIRLHENDKVEFEEKFRKVLENLLSLHKRTNSEIGRQILKKCLDYFIDQSSKNISRIDSQYNYIWRSNKAREKRGEKIQLKYQKLSGQQEKLFDLLRINWDKYENCVCINEWLDFIEIQKIKIGFLSFVYDISLVEDLFTDKIKNHFPKVGVIGQRYEKKTSDSVNSVLQQAIFSEFRGTVSKMSTEAFITRYVIQPMYSETKYPIVTECKKYGEKRTKGQKYYINFNKNESVSDKSELSRLSGKQIKAGVFKKINISTDSLANIISSKYNLQFLDNSMSGSWKDLSPSVFSYSFIYEEQVKIKWTVDGPEFSVAGKRLFVSIPFELGYVKSDARNLELVRRNVFLGIDIGEYGIAMYVLKSKSMSLPLFKYFLYEPVLRKIREGIKTNVTRQRFGTFSIPNTNVARVRNNAITKIRNRIHDIVIRFNARPIYEKEVSAFESGSGKISKIYHSIKKSDTYGAINADTEVQELVWGGKPKQIGKDVSAYATSYMCSHCYKSIYALITKDDYKKEYKVLEVSKPLESKLSGKKQKKNHIVLFDINGENVHGYIDGNSIDMKKGEHLNGKTVQVAVKKYARPPLKILLENTKSLKDDFETKVSGKSLKEKIEIFERVRGSQSIFRCPFCNKLSDADIQAAMWIALKGYLNMYVSSNKEEQQEWKDLGIEKGWNAESLKEKLAFLMNFARENKIPPIEMDFNTNKNNNKNDGKNTR